MFSDDIRRRLQYFLPFYTNEFTVNVNCNTIVKSLNNVTVNTGVNPHGLEILQDNDYFHIVNIGSSWNIVNAEILVNQEPYISVQTETANFIKTGTAFIKVSIVDLFIKDTSGNVIYNISGKYSVDVNISGVDLFIRNSQLLSAVVYHDIIANGYVLDYANARIVLNNPPRITDKTFNRVIKKAEINVVDNFTFTYQVDEQEAEPYIFNGASQIRKNARIYTAAITAQELFNNNNNVLYNDAETNPKGSSAFVLYTGLRSISNPKDLYGQNARSDFYLQQLVATYSILLCVRTGIDKEDHKRYSNTLSYISKNLVPYIIKDLHGKSFMYEDDWLKHAGTLGLQDHTILNTAKQTLLPYLIEFNCQQRIDGTALTEDGPGIVAKEIDFYIKNNFSLDNENIISGNVSIDNI